MARFINMFHDDIPNRITLVDEKAYENVWKDKGWQRWTSPSIEAPESGGKSGKAKKPTKKKLTSSSQAEETT